MDPHLRAGRWLLETPFRRPEDNRRRGQGLVPAQRSNEAATRRILLRNLKKVPDPIRRSCSARERIGGSYLPPRLVRPCGGRIMRLGLTQLKYIKNENHIIYGYVPQCPTTRFRWLCPVRIFLWRGRRIAH